MRSWLVAITLLAGTPNLFSQNVKLTATADTTTIRIGEQFGFTISADYRIDKGEVAFTLPEFPDSLSDKIEVIRQDSLVKFLPDKSDQFRFREEQHYVLTSFRPGDYTIPAFSMMSNGQLLTTAPIYITVNTVAVDTTMPIKPIKEIFAINAELDEDEAEEAEFDFMTWLKDNWIWLLIVFLILGLAAYQIWRARKQKPTEDKQEVQSVLTPDMIALQQLEALREKQLWQAGRTKDYHVELTEILRSYIESRFHIPAHEQTTDEIVNALRFATIDERMKMVLNQVLRLSDMVKFAKEQPIGTENEQSFDSARAFVKETRLLLTHEKKQA